MFEEARVYNIKDLYKFTRDNNRKLLSEYGSDFWAGYRANSSYFDRRFMKLYASWFPMDQDPDETLQSIQEDFTYDVYAHLMANDKRYSELYRVNVIPDNDAYSLTNNVDYTETTERTIERDIEFNKGSQTDTEDNSRTKGSQTDTQDNSRTKGSQTDTQDNSRTKGSETITEDNSMEYGAHQTDVTNSTSAYNESTFTATDKSTTESGIHTDNEDKERIEGQRIDTEDLSSTYGQRIDTEDLSSTYGQRIDTEDLSRTEGTRKDTTADDTSEDVSVHKVGNMGVQTVDDMLLKHWDNWTLFDFYGLIFSEIARDLLRGC